MCRAAQVSSDFLALVSALNDLPGLMSLADKVAVGVLLHAYYETKAVKDCISALWCVTMNAFFRAHPDGKINCSVGLRLKRFGFKCKLLALCEPR
jgi:hypothetical protein